MAVHARLKNEFTEEEKCHNLMSWLKSFIMLSSKSEANTVIPLRSSYYAPNFKEIDGAYWFRVVRACIRLCIRSSRTVHARVLKFHIWIPHGKIVDAHFFSCPCCLPFWSYAPLKKSEWNLMHAISYEPCMLGFWNFMYGFLMEK